MVARYVLSLAPLTLLTHSAALRFAMLASLARFVDGLAHSLRSLPRGTVEILEYACSRCYRVSRVQTRVSSSLETHPKCSPDLPGLTMTQTAMKYARKQFLRTKRLKVPQILMVLTDGKVEDAKARHEAVVEHQKYVLNKTDRQTDGHIDCRKVNR